MMKDMLVPMVMENRSSLEVPWLWLVVTNVVVYWTTTSTSVDMVNAIESDSSSTLWHKRLSHISEKGFNVLAKKKLLSNFQSSKLEQCEHCLAGKQNRASFKFFPSSRKIELLELVHSNLCGPMKTKTLGGALYFVTLLLIARENFGSMS